MHLYSGIGAHCAEACYSERHELSEQCFDCALKKCLVFSLDRPINWIDFFILYPSNVPVHFGPIRYSLILPSRMKSLALLMPQKWTAYRGVHVNAEVVVDRLCQPPATLIDGMRNDIVVNQRALCPRVRHRNQSASMVSLIQRMIHELSETFACNEQSKKNKTNENDWMKSHFEIN